MLYFIYNKVIMVNKINNNKDLIALSGLVSFVIISGLFLSSSLASADDSTVATASVTVPASCTMSGTGMNSHTAEIQNGIYQNNIGTTTLHAFCNDANGFAIYAAGYTGNEIGGTNSNKLVGTAATNNATIVTGLATSTPTPDVSNWAMKLAVQSDSGNTTGTNAVTIDSDTEGSFANYHTIPNEYKKVAHKNTATDMTASTGGVKLTTTYAAYISKTQPADTYTGQVIYTLVHPTSAPAPVVCNPNGTTVGTDTSTDITCMQDISSTNKSSILSSMTTGTQYTLTDKRDNKTYTVSKLADNNIWMTQNLDLDLDSNTTYTNLDTDLGWNGTSYGTASWSPERSTYATGTTTWGLYNSTTGNHDGNWHPESYDPGDLYWNGTLSDWSDWEAYHNSCTHDDDTWLYSNCDETLNPIATYTTVSGTPTAQYHLGNFYNWSAAIASNDSSAYGVYDSGTYSYTNKETNQSICPAGWTLPIGDYFESSAPSKSFQNLVEQYGWDNNSYQLSNNRKIWESPIYVGLSGDWYGILGNVGGSVDSWSSVASNDEYAYGLDAGSDGTVSPSDGSDRGRGFVVRCVVR